MINNFIGEIKKLGTNKCEPAATINKVTGSKNITDMWCNHYEELLNSSTDNSAKSYVIDCIDKSTLHLDRFTIAEVLTGIKDLKSGKACGLDDIYAEHLKNSHDKLAVLLAIVFNE